MKNVVITGATSGIGEAAARLFTQKGHRVFLIGRNTAKLQSLGNELNASSAVCDVRHYQQVVQAMEQAKSALGSIDVVVNNAGLGFFSAAKEGDIDQWHEMVDTNIKGVLNVLHASMPELSAARGHVINIGSVASHQVFPNSGVYCATKHAVWAISEMIRLELPSEIRVTTISPGSVNTAFIDKTTDPKMLSDYKNYFAAGMSPELIAEQIVWAAECPPNAVITEIIVRPSRQSK